MVACGNFSLALCQKSVCVRCITVFNLADGTQLAPILANGRGGQPAQERAKGGASSGGGENSAPERVGLSGAGIAIEGSVRKGVGEGRVWKESGRLDPGERAPVETTTSALRKNVSPTMRWICPHCTGRCPKRAKCFAYDRQTMRRRERAQRLRREAATGPVERGKSEARLTGGVGRGGSVTVPKANVANAAV